MQVWEMVSYTNYLPKSVEIKGELLEDRNVNTKGDQDVKKSMNNWTEVHDTHPDEEELVWLSFNKEVIIRNSGKNSSRGCTRGPGEKNSRQWINGVPKEFRDERQKCDRVFLQKQV